MWKVSFIPRKEKHISCYDISCSQVIKEGDKWQTWKEETSKNRYLFILIGNEQCELAVCS